MGRVPTRSTGMMRSLWDAVYSAGDAAVFLKLGGGGDVLRHIAALAVEDWLGIHILGGLLEGGGEGSWYTAGTFRTSKKGSSSAHWSRMRLCLLPLDIHEEHCRCQCLHP